MLELFACCEYLHCPGRSINACKDFIISIGDVQVCTQISVGLVIIQPVPIAMYGFTTSGNFYVVIEDRHIHLVPELGVSIETSSTIIPRNNNQVGRFKLKFLIGAEVFIVSVRVYMDMDVSTVNVLQKFGVTSFGFGGIPGYDDDVKRLRPGATGQSRQQD